MIHADDTLAFPTLTTEEMQRVENLAERESYLDGETIIALGAREIGLIVVLRGEMAIRNPHAGDIIVAVHHPRQFAGDIDLLTGRPVIICGIAQGETEVLRVPQDRMRVLLNRIPSLGEKLIVAFMRRRELIPLTGNVGLQVYGGSHCKDTHLVREFLYKNFVPFTWIDTDVPAGKEQLHRLGDYRRTPVIDSGTTRLVEPTLKDLATAAGVWKACPEDVVDLAIVGAGPAGMAAAVYAASEGINTLLIDRLGPGGQAGGSSKIENFIGFPAGLTGAELATRGILQMLKFGARMAAPYQVEKLVPANSLSELHQLKMDCGTVVQAKVVLIATGVNWKRLPVADAARFEGNGIHYVCTTVESHLYDTQDVAVVGAGNSAGQAVMFLAECCRSRKVHLVIRNKLGPGMSEYLVKRICTTPNIIIHEGAEITALTGQRHLEEFTITRKEIDNRVTMPCAGVFVFIGSDPCTSWLPGEIAKDASGFVMTGSDVVRAGKWTVADRDPCPLETSLPGILAAGDIRSGSTKRVGFAVGDGSLAVTCTHKLLGLRR